MKKTFAAILFILFVSNALAQTKPVNLFDSARVYYEKKDFKKAFYFYDTYYANPEHAQSNYDTYYTAVAACQSGQPDKARYYLLRSQKIGYNLSDYTTFADDPLNGCLRELPEWKNFITTFKIKADSATAALKIITDGLTDTSMRVNHSLMADGQYWKALAAKSTPQQLLDKIKTFNKYPSPKQTGFWTLYHIRVNDTLSAPYLVYIPQSYKPGNKAPLYVFMHGGVSGPQNFGNPAYTPLGQKKLFQKAFQQGAFIIYPYARKNFNWLYHQQAFETIIKEIGTVKSLYNIDDNKVYIGGHSDGGRGAVWFAMNSATTFAAFYGICYFPSVYTGDTFFRNLHNGQPFFGISAVNDDLFPFNMVNQIVNYDIKEGGNWKKYGIQGSHNLPYSSTDSVYFLFDELLRTTRNPSPKKLVWETANIKNGKYYWLTINQMDTTLTPATWHTPLNPTVTQNGKTGKAQFTRHKSAAVRASVSGNIISISTSCVKAFTINLPDGLIDIKKPVTIEINGENKFYGTLKPDKQLMLNSFLESHDRALVSIAQLYFSGFGNSSK